MISYYKFNIIIYHYISIIYQLYIDPGGGVKSPPPLRFFALTHLILGLDYCALGTFPKKID